MKSRKIGGVRGLETPIIGEQIGRHVQLASSSRDDNPSPSPLALLPFLSLLQGIVLFFFPSRLSPDIPYSTLTIGHLHHFGNCE